ncbi:MAG: hypothetical protein KGY99_09480 [Phycisphaerae bacterium]|nr:hypothetical protein [Phycisphaerae bacterium]
MKHYRALLLLFPFAAIACGPSAAELRKTARIVPDCWQPYLNATVPMLTPEHLGEADVVIANADRRRQYVAVYDRRADRWQSFEVPAGMVYADTPHVWWLFGDGSTSHYWNMRTDAHAEFPHPPKELFEAGPRLPDQGLNALACLAGDAIYSWRHSEKKYARFDPFERTWRDLSGAETLPRGQAVLDAAETDAHLTLSLGPPAYCIMRPGLPWDTYRYDKESETWAKIAAAPPGAGVVPAGSGFWLLSGGAGRWIVAGEQADPSPSGADWYAMVRAAGRLWGRSAQGWVEVTGADNVTGEPVPSLTPATTARGLFAYDGRYLWQWSGQAMDKVIRYTPGRNTKKTYATVEGLRGRAYEMAFTSRAVWVNGQRYDAVTKRRTRFEWRGDPLPEGDIWWRAAVGQRRTLLMAQPRMRREEIIGYGMGVYDPKTNVATYYSLETIRSGNWPYHEMLSNIARLHGQGPDSGINLLEAWVWLRRAHSVRSGQSAILTHGGKLFVGSPQTGWQEAGEGITFWRPSVVTPEAVWSARMGGRLVRRYDRDSGELTYLGPRVHEEYYPSHHVRHGDEWWFTLVRRNNRGQNEIIGSAILNTATGQLNVHSRCDREPFGEPVSPVAMDDERIWGVYVHEGLRRGVIVTQDRKTGKWTHVPYIDGDRIWFHGQWAYANIDGQLHRADRAALLATLESPQAPPGPSASRDLQPHPCRGVLQSPPASIRHAARQAKRLRPKTEHQ